MLVSLLVPVLSYAQVHGSISGTVVDESGKPLPGVTIMLLGTKKGAKTKPNGKYIINGIPANSYDVKASHVAKADKMIKGVRVLSGQSTTLDIEMVDKVKTTETIVVTAARDQVKVDVAGSQDVVTSETMNKVASENLVDIISMKAGVTNSGSGYSIRGARQADTQILLDGMDMSNKFTGGMGIGGSKYYPTASAAATESAQVMKGGMGAEYSGFGAVNSAMKAGRNDRYEGYVRYRTDLPFLFGRQSSALNLVRTGNNFEFRNEGEGYKLQGSNEGKYEFGIGGPIPGFNDVTFFMSGYYFHEDYRGASYEILDPLGNNMSQVPNNQTWMKNITGKFTYDISTAVKMVVGGTWGMTNFENADYTSYYLEGEGMSADSVYNGVNQGFAKINVANQVLSNIYVKMNHFISSSMFYELRVARSANSDYQGRRNNFDDPSFMGGFDILEPEDKLVPQNDIFISGTDFVVDQYTQMNTVTGYTKDGYLKGEVPVRNPLTGYYEGRPYSGGTGNAFGLQNTFVSDGSAGGGFSFREGSYIQMDGKFSWILDLDDVRQELTAGFNFKLHELHRHYNGTPYDGDPSYDLYTDKWGGNIYATTDQYVYDKTSKPFKPKSFDFFAEDRINYKDVTVQAGMRVDYFDASSQYRLPNDTYNFVSIGDEAGLADVSSKVNISPKVGVNYKITDQSVFKINYGIYYSYPAFQLYYDGFNKTALRTSAILGNPDLDAQRKNEYQVAYEANMTEDLIVELSAYYNDIYNEVGTVYIPAVPIPYYQYTITEYGNSRGVELNLRKRPVDHFNFEINYTLGWSTGTSSSATSNSSLLLDPFTDNPMFPLAAYPTSRDIRHRVSATANIFWGDDEGPSIAGIQPLQNMNINLTGRFNSGSPYTLVDMTGNMLSSRNSEVGPSYWNLDMRLMKTIKMNEIWEGAGDTEIEFFLDVDNILDITEAYSFYNVTQDPDDDGRLSRVSVGDYSAVIWYKEADFTNAETFNNSQYDFYGNRMYNEQADIDGNGQINQIEKYESYINYVEKIRSFKGNYKTPRTVYFGFKVKF
jgi:outer membrane receptor for ferrienterochelin and colicin